jgi:extracellular factor (EF) 3-hydroxypalmitic acid methyl ester biosynthesis protein
VHRAYAQRQLHTFMLGSPFLYRTYAKPLGFAGDYEMINMIIRNRPAGGSLLARLIDGFLLDQAPPQAVRSRVGYLKDRIVETTARVTRSGRKASIYSLGCGPAREVEDFVSSHALADRAQFRLLDFNDETLQYVAQRVAHVSNAKFDKASVKLVKNSVQNLLKSGARSAADEPTFDLIYCSGLYDYLSDRVCRSLNNYLYDRLAPGGKLVIGNFAPWTPRQNVMEHLAEWFLIYRDTKRVSALAPERASPEDCKVWAEPTGSNIFLEATKPE